MTVIILSLRHVAVAVLALAPDILLFTVRNIRFQTKFQLFKSLVVSILLYECETWTLMADDERRIQAFETKLSLIHI